MKKKKKKLLRKLRDIEAQLALVRATIKGGGVDVWRKLDGPHVAIAEMDDKHLINALCVCLRNDPRYRFDAERKLAFFAMAQEATKRGILHRVLHGNLGAPPFPLESDRC